MAHPKRKISRTRRDKRRTHHKLTPSMYRPHQAEWQDGDLYYKGELILKKSSAATSEK